MISETYVLIFYTLLCTLCVVRNLVKQVDTTEDIGNCIKEVDIKLKKPQVLNTVNRFLNEIIMNPIRICDVITICF